MSDEFRWEWVSIPHIYHTPFYVYAYTFGQLLVLSLYQQFKAEGEGFKPRYLGMLSAGGSEAPVKILAAAGIDVYSAQFWQGGFDVIQRLVEQLEKLAAALMRGHLQMAEPSTLFAGAVFPGGWRGIAPEPAAAEPGRPGQWEPWRPYGGNLRDCCPGRARDAVRQPGRCDGVRGQPAGGAERRMDQPGCTPTVCGRWRSNCAAMTSRWMSWLLMFSEC